MRDTWKSKKLWFCVGAVLVIFGFALLAGLMPALGPMYDTFVGGVVAITGLLLTGNIANKWVTGKAAAAATTTTKKPLQGEPVEEAPPEEE